MNISDSKSEDIVIPEEAAILASIFSVFVIIVGIIGNSLTILALVKGSPKLQSHATTKFVINLAITDLLFCSVNLPLTTVRYWTRSWPFGTFLCHLYPFFFYANVATSLLSITCITVNRFATNESQMSNNKSILSFRLVFIAFNLRYNQIYKRLNVWLMICFCWLFSFGLMLWPLLGVWGQFGLKKSTFSCTIISDSEGRSPKKFLFILGFVIPITVIIICYTFIWIHVRKQTSLTVKTSKRDLKLTKLIFVIFGAFLICFAPNTIANVWVNESKYPYLHVLSAMLCWLNSCVNPFIYFAMNPKYRLAFKRVLRLSRRPTTSFYGQESITSDQTRAKSDPIYTRNSYLIRHEVNGPLIASKIIIESQ